MRNQGRAPYILPYEGTEPKIAGRLAYAGADSAILGRTTIGHGCWIGTRAVIRADGHFVEIGDNFRLGARSTVHIAHDVYPAIVGDDVTAGVNCIIHACTVGDRCHLGNNVVILDGSVVEAGCAIADNSVVFPRSELKAGWFYQGQPAAPVRQLAQGELEALHAASRSAEDELVEVSVQSGVVKSETPVFVARTAKLRGLIEAEGGNGIWFSCDLSAEHKIEIGENTNIQDNSIIKSIEAPVLIGPNSTIGHNVVMTDCVIGRDSLIGIGATIAPGTVVGSNVLLAAGASTAPGQVLESGFLYGGHPARPLSKMDERKSGMIQGNWPIYRAYAQKYRAAQESIE